MTTLAAITVAPATTVATPTTAPATTTAAAPSPNDLAAFDRQEVRVGDEEWTVAVAATEEQRAQGLMLVTALDAVDGMLFVFPSDGTGGFWMKDTLIPLDIAFFDVDGRLVDVLSMVPCEEDPCLVYRPSGAYRYALEANPGRLDALSDAALLQLSE